MHYSTFKFALDLQVVQSQVSIPVKFGDTAVRLYITLTDGGVPFTLTEGFLAVLSGVKSDGNKLFNNCMIDLKNSAIIYDFTEQTATSEGITQCEIILYSPDGKVLGTPRFIMLVDNRLVYDSNIVSAEENTAIDEMIIAGNEAIANVNEAMDTMMSGTKGLKFTLNEDGKSYSVTGYDGISSDIYIAPTHRGLPVTHIAYGAFSGRSIKTVSLPKGLTHIGEAAFAGCTHLVQINIPKSIEFIGDWAFADTGLTSIAIREDIAEDDLVLSDNTFGGCEALKDIYLSWDKDSGSDTNPPWGATNATVHYGVRPATTLDIAREAENLNNRFATKEYVDQANSEAVGEAVAEAVKEANSYASTTFANALKGKVSGEAVAMKDVSPVEHTLGVKVSGVEDVSNVKVKKLGKNILPYPYKSKSLTYNGITYTINPDGTVLVNGTATSASYIDLTESAFTASLAGKTVRLSGCPKGGSGATYMLRWQIRNDDKTTLHSVDDVGFGVTVNISEQATVGTPRITVMGGVTVNNLLFKPQIELGTTSSGYEPYIAPTEYPVNADGTVEGITPLPSGTTLTTDTAGAVITAEYNRDINRAFEDLVNAIISMGGNV